MTHNRNQQGFGLIELLVTLAVITMVISIGVPSFQSFTKKNRAETRIDEINSGLRLARQVAVEHNFESRVCARSSNALNSTACSANASDWNNGFVVQIATPAGNWETLLNKTYSNANSNITVVYGGTLEEEVRFGATGNLSTGTQVFVKVALSGCEATSVINIAGRISTSSLTGC